MATDLKSITTQGKDLWTKLPRNRRIMLIGALVATVLAIVVLTRKPAEKYAVLFSGMSSEDACEVVAVLQAQGVPYKLEAGGTAVSVPEGKALDLRLDLAG